MLLQLRIRDFAIIDAVELEVRPGFTVVTGETGAGKSILIDALLVALGGRGNANLVRSTSETAEVEALFDISGHPVVRARLEQRDLVGDDPDVLLIRRVLGPKGRAKVTINGRLSTVATLGEVVRGLVDVCGQHQQLSLLAPDNHLEILDAFGGLDGTRAQYREGFDQWRTLSKEAERLRSDEAEIQRRADFLRFQLDEIERVDPHGGELDELEAECQRLRHSEKLKQGASVAEGLLYGGDGSAFDKLGKATAEVRALSGIDADLGATVDSLEAAQRELEDSARDLQRYANRIEADPARLDASEERLAQLRLLCRKHGGTLKDVVARRQQLAAELAGLENRDVRLLELEAELETAARRVYDLGQALSEARQHAAKALQAAIHSEVADMELADAVFATQLAARRVGADSLEIDGRGVGPNGLDGVEFLWSANPGEPPKALAKIVSGGELSRLTLAVKRALSHRDLVSVYVFDEVDTGLGGKAADSIGRKIQDVARGHQALTITHLAPIAARADHHLLVTKQTRAGRTTSTVETIIDGPRDEEIARMMDGARITEATRQAARAMLARAKEDFA